MKKLVFAMLAAIALFGCKKEEEALPEEAVLNDGYVYPPIYTTAAYVALAEKPDMRRVILIGESAHNVSNAFHNAGVRAETQLSGKYDAAFVTCEGMSKESYSKMMSLLTENGIAVWLMDVSALRMGEFEEMIEAFDSAEAHLWMIGEKTWALVGRKSPKQIKLSAIMEAFTRESAVEDIVKAKLDHLSSLFASYVGVKEDVLPAFGESDKKALVRCEYFLPREIPKISWIAGDVDEDILKTTMDEIRSMQVIRRLIVEGAMEATKGDEDAAIEKLSRAALRNPNDPMLLERLDRLDRNASGFLAVQKVLMAMKCYETIITIQPKDVRAITNFAMCLKTIGKTDLAEEVLKRAKELSAK